MKVREWCNLFDKSKMEKGSKLEEIALPSLDKDFDQNLNKF